MIRCKQFFLLFILCCGCLLTFQMYAEAPVVDDSENFVILEEEQAAFEQPVARTQMNVRDNDEEPALANDTIQTNNKSNNAILLDKIQGLQQDLQELRGQLEVQARELKLLQQQQLAFYKDLDARLRQEPMRTASAVTEELKSSTANDQWSPKTIPAATARHSNPADEQISYLAAYELIKNKKFNDALVAMQKFMDQYPQSGYSANAQYWMGELYMVQHNYPKAIHHFKTVISQFPSSSKTEASQLKIGYALAASGKKNDAIQYLQQVVRNYPDTHTAELAMAKLESLSA